MPARPQVELQHGQRRGPAEHAHRQEHRAVDVHRHAEGREGQPGDHDAGAQEPDPVHQHPGAQGVLAVGAEVAMPGALPGQHSEHHDQQAIGAGGQRAGQVQLRAANPREVEAAERGDQRGQQEHAAIPTVQGRPAASKRGDELHQAAGGDEGAQQHVGQQLGVAQGVAGDPAGDVRLVVHGQRVALPQRRQKHPDDVDHEGQLPGDGGEEPGADGWGERWVVRGQGGHGGVPERVPHRRRGRPSLSCRIGNRRTILRP